MKKTVYIVALCFAITTLAWGAPFESTEAWEGSGTGGWSNRSDDVTLSNPGGYLDVGFRGQTRPVSVADTAEAELGAAVLLTNLVFRFRAGDTLPSAARVSLRIGDTDRVWSKTFAVSRVGDWEVVNVSVSDYPGWSRGPDSTEAAFRRDLLQVTSVGVYVRRHGATGTQSYGLDDFVMQGLAIAAEDGDADGMRDTWEGDHDLDPLNPLDAREDADGDGFINYHEFRAGSDPNDPDSLLALAIDDLAVGGVPVQGVVLRWQSASNRSYTLWRTLDLQEGDLEIVADEVAATPPTNEYEDTAATNGAAFYFIELRD